MENIFQIVLTVAAILISVSFHEAAHAYAAWKMGDPTAKLMGRITLNPIKHLDLVGSVIVPLVLSLMHLPGFGWAKPVRVNPANFRDLRKGEIIVSLAGVMTNLGLAIVAGLIIRVATFYINGSGALSVPPALVQALQFLNLFVYLNLILFVFNLLPIPPLDGSRALAALFPVNFHGVAKHMQAASFALLIILLATGNLDTFISAVVRPLYTMITGFGS